jgi:tetratricopeptide (TPR) repeat protein
MNPLTLSIAFLLVMAFSLGVRLQPHLSRSGEGREDDNVFKVLLGDGRRMFANHFFVKADVYYHRGSYPSIFDQAAAADASDTAQPAAADHDHDHEHDEHDHEHAEMPGGRDVCDTDFRGRSRDWIEAFGRNFFVTRHSHLDGGEEREMLPWLKLSAQLDPQHIDTYTVGAYWLASRLNKPREAAEFLLEGLRANPKSYEILFQLGEIYRKQFKQPDRARNVWEAALRRWDEAEPGKETPDNVFKSRILDNLAQLEAEQGNYLKAIRRYEQSKKYSPMPAVLEERIQDTWSLFAVPAPPPPANSR